MPKKLIQTLQTNDSSVLSIYLVGGDYELVLPGGRRIGRVESLAMAEAAALAYHEGRGAGCSCC